MKYAPELYAKAFLEVADTAPAARRGELVQRFFEVIRKNGDWQAREKIAAAVEQHAVERGGGRMVTIEVARESLVGEVKRLVNLFHKPDRTNVTVNPELLAGVRVTVDGKRELDQSLASRIRAMFVRA